MRIGIDCFTDMQLRSIIKSENKKGYCDIQDKDKVYIYDTNISHENDLHDNILSILDVYTPKSEFHSPIPSEYFGKIEYKIKENWNIFSVGPENIKKIILSICHDDYKESDKLFQEDVAMMALTDSEFLSKNRITKDKTWNDFSKIIKYGNRFHHNINLDILKELFLSESLQVTLFTKNKFFRARINNTERKYTKKEMSCPPPGKGSAGRINPQGISCLYLADSVETALNEVRARCHDTVSIAKFYPVKDIKIIDLSLIDQISPFSGTSFDLERFTINMKILKEIRGDLAKPLRRQDSILDYLPSQYIAEYIKYLGYDGIAFPSTLHQTGKNYAVFDSSMMKCKKVSNLHISELSYKYEYN